MKNILTKNHLTIKKIFNKILTRKEKTKMEKINYYTVKYRPYKDWGIWTKDLFMYEDQLQEFLKSKAEIIKVTKHRKLPKEYKQEN